MHEYGKLLPQNPVVNAQEPFEDMHVPQDPQLSMAPLSPTLTNPDMILPDNPPSADSSPSTPWKPQRLPPPPSPTDHQHTTSDSLPDHTSQEMGAMFSPFKNGLLRRHDGSAKQRSGSEKDGGKTASREENTLPSSPTLQEDHKIQTQNGETDAAAQDYHQVDTRESTYSPPSILDEDEDDPYSHAAMTRRAEEILANAKKRLTVSSRDGWIILGRRLLT